MELSKYYVLIAYLVSLSSAQVVKPFIEWKKTGKFNITIVKDSGGFPSSHSSSVSALTTAVALSQGFDSPLFAMCLVFSVIACYDAANVRYYSGKNIQITKKLVEDLKENSEVNLTDEIYDQKMKEVLGHTYFQMLSGVVWGILIALLVYVIMF